MNPAYNVLVLMSDEHNPNFLGCAGHPYIQTPHLDRLAARGARLTSAYTCSPICVPARAAFATGRYVHEVGFWDNADAYDGVPPSWHYVLRQAGHRASSIGKLHFRGRAGDDHGWSEEVLPMHIIDGIGDVKGLVREHIPVRKGGDKMAKLAGPGESSYTKYDRQIAQAACQWLEQRAQQADPKPWTLFVSMVSPHFPLTAPERWFNHYASMDLPMPKLYGKAERPHHPFTDEYARVVDYDTHFHSDADVKRALAGYCGLVSFMDEQMGQVLGALDRLGLAHNTLVIYTSDHGDNLGARGLWGKSTLYEESAGVPLILAGPQVPAGAVVHEPVSHVDIPVTILEAAGAPALPQASGHSLMDILRGCVPRRPVLSEYHAIGSTGGATMLRVGHWKYCHYTDHPPQLFDLQSDPQELCDLAGDPAHADRLRQCLSMLLQHLDPQEVDRRAKARQQALLSSYGGREAALARGDLGFTPAPGTDAAYN
ncbi:MAG: sulfatase-like hydrolase/transferase [Betaproteobacteria bacterium]